MWAIGRYDLGLTEQEFWKMTLRQFSLMVDRRNKRDEVERDRADFHAALICSVVASCHSKKSWKPKEFMPTYTNTEQTWEEQLNYIQILNAAMGGTDRRCKH